MKIFKLYKSSKQDKKYMIVTETKKIHFGANGYNDYIIYNKINKNTAYQKKRNYIKRHNINENWTDYNTSGFWSRWLLWNKPTLHDSITSTEKRFNIKIINNT